MCNDQQAWEHRLLQLAVTDYSIPPIDTMELVARGRFDEYYEEGDDPSTALEAQLDYWKSA